MNFTRFSLAVLAGLLAFYLGWWAIASPWYLAMVLWYLVYRNGLHCILLLVSILVSTFIPPVNQP